MLRFAALSCALALTLAVAAPARAADGELVQVRGDAKIYRVVGGAPLWVVGECSRIDCSGRTMVDNLGGYGRYPRDGAVSQGGSDGGIYRWAGGAPLWLGSCAYADRCVNSVEIDDVSYADWDHVRPLPADGTVIRNVSDGGFYRFAGGAPLVVRCDIGPGCVDPPQFDKGTFENNGSITRGRQNMRTYPADGTTVQNVDDGVYYRFAGGAPLPLSSCAGCSAQIVDNRTFQLSGSATPGAPRMAAAPADGTYLSTGAAVYRVVGGAALQMTDCGQLGGCAGAVSVDAGTISGLGGGRLLAAPRDGTVLRGLPSKTLWEIVGGKRRQTFINVSGLDVDDGALGAIPLEGPQLIPTPVAPPFAPAIRGEYAVRSKRTRFTALSARQVPAGARVVITCKGGRKRGCAYTNKSYKVSSRGTVNALKDWRSKRLHSTAVVTFTVTSADGARKLYKWTMRATKLPKRVRQCAAPGARLRSC